MVILYPLNLKKRGEREDTEEKRVEGRMEGEERKKYPWFSTGILSQKLYSFKTTAPYVILQDNPPDDSPVFLQSNLRLLMEVQPGNAICTGSQTI